MSLPQAPAQERSGRLWVACTLLAWLSLILGARAALDRPVFALSHDDFLRIALADAVAPDNLLPGDLWPPLQAWITALALQILPEVRTTPGLVNVACALGALLGTARLAGRLGLGPRGQALAVALLGLLPWWNLLALSALAEPMATCAMTWALVGMVDLARGERRGAPLAAGAIALGGMVRYEAWALGALLLPLLVPRARSRLRLPTLGLTRRERGAWGALPWVFPLAWMGLEWHWNGDPLFFATMARENLVGDENVSALPLHAPLALAVAVGPLVLLAGVGLRAAWRAADPGLRALAALAGVGLGVQLLAQLLALAGTHNTERHYVAWAPPLAALAVAGLARLARARALTLAGASAALGMGLLREIPDALDPEVARMAARVATIRAGGTLGTEDRVLIEAAPWECFALQVALAEARPGITAGLAAVTWDRDPFTSLGAQETLADRMENPSLLAQPEAELRGDLERLGVGLVVTATARGAEQVSRVGVPAGSAGRWRAWRLSE